MDQITVGGRPSIMAWLLLFLTALCLTLGITLKETNWLMGASIPFALTISFLPFRSKKQTIIFEDDGLIVDDEGEIIPYEDIEGLLIGGRVPDPDQRKDFPKGDCHLYLADRVYVISALTETQAQNFMQTMIEYLPRTGSDYVGQKLRKRLENDTQTFDSDLVNSFSARAKLLSSPSAAWKALLAIILSGIAQIIFAIVSENDGWGVSGFICLMVGLLVFLISKAKRPQIKDWEFASMVISPKGLALEQGPLVGQIGWEEIRSLECGIKNIKFYRTIRIVVDGSEILIHDIYDRPLSVIFDVMDSFYRE